jgi:hypothetical protein
MPLAPGFVRHLRTRDPRWPPWIFSFTELLSGGFAEDGRLYVWERLPAPDGDASRGYATGVYRG